MKVVFLLISLTTSQIFAKEMRIIRCSVEDSTQSPHFVDFKSEGIDRTEGVDQVAAIPVSDDKMVALDDMATLKSPLIRSDEINDTSRRPIMSALKIVKQGLENNKSEQWLNINLHCKIIK